jgi:hypothetical protein
MTTAIEQAAHALVYGGGVGGFGPEDDNTIGAKLMLATNDATVAVDAALRDGSVLNTISNLLYRYDHESEFGVEEFTSTLRSRIVGVDSTTLTTPSSRR